MGTNKSDNKNIVLTPVKRNSLWRVELTVPNNVANNKKITGKNNIVIKGLRAGSPFRVVINKEIELEQAVGM